MATNLQPNVERTYQKYAATSKTFRFDFQDYWMWSVYCMKSHLLCNTYIYRIKIVIYAIGKKFTIFYLYLYNFICYVYEIYMFDVQYTQSMFAANNRITIYGGAKSNW